METHGGTSRYLNLTLGCKTCRLLAKQIGSARANGGYYRSRGWSLKRTHVEVRGRRANVDVRVNSAPTTFKMTATGPVQHYSGGPLSFRLSLSWIRSGWRVTHVLQLAA
jgi:hypothetical protein